MSDNWTRTPDWSQLTHDPQKHRHYGAEFEYRLAWEELVHALGSKAESTLLDYTMLVLKPECFRRRVSGQVLRIVADRGFTLVDADIRHIPPADDSYIWRFQWNSATSDRLRLFAIKNRGESSAILLLRRPAADHQGVPASVHLASVKGSSAFLERRQATDLRTVLDIPNRALTFIHSPDEPADVLREFVSLMPDNDRLIARLLGGEDSSRAITDQVLAQESKTTPHSVRFSEVAARRGLAATGIEERPLKEVRPIFSDLSDDLERWDFVTYAAGCIRHDRPDEGPVISTRFLPQILASWASAASRPVEPLRATAGLKD
jgi:hypothetical protein